MLDERIYESYIGILKEEMVPAMGCTEPIALAYGAARAREVLGKEPEHITAKCSGNIIKNVRCVIIPNSGGLTGIEAGVVLGETGKKINKIYAMGDYFALMSGDDMYEATTVILATGVEYGKPIKGEEEFLGKGVGFCATCDAPLY